MSIYKQIPIQMTSNNTPEPFLIDNVVNKVPDLSSYRILKFK